MDPNASKESRPEEMTRPDTPYQQPPMGAEPTQPVHERTDVPPAPEQRGRPCGLFVLTLFGVLTATIAASLSIVWRHSLR